MSHIQWYNKCVTLLSFECGAYFKSYYECVSYIYIICTLLYAIICIFLLNFRGGYCIDQAMSVAAAERLHHHGANVMPSTAYLPLPPAQMIFHPPPAIHQPLSINSSSINLPAPPPPQILHYPTNSTNASGDLQFSQNSSQWVFML